MSDANKAVFLSYASQDAEAAKRICEALRASGVQVWFDADGGLEHGDEWDAKIRRQIKECVLFLPIISANTQAREEGYFRIEWDLAAERARGIAAGVAFILPVVIDDTREPDALVPDRFRTVQWTRLREGNVPAEVLQRFLKLWSHRAGVLKQQAQATATSSSPAGETGPTRTHRPAWSYGAVAAIVVGITTALWVSRRSGDTPKPVSPAVTTPVASGEAADRVVKPVRDPALTRAEALIYSLDAIPEDFSLAEDLVKPLAAARPNDPEVTTVYAEVLQEGVTRGFNVTLAGRAQAQNMTERAVQLAPDDPAALGTLARYLLFVRSQLSRAEELVRRAIALDPTEPRFQRTLYGILSETRSPAEIEGFEKQMAAAFPNDVLVHYDIARRYKDVGDLERAEISFDRTIAVKPIASALVWKAWLMLELHGDVAGMEAALDRVPERQRATTRVTNAFAIRAEITGRTEVAERLINAVGDEWLSDFDFNGPKALLMGDLARTDGRADLARVQYQAALEAVHQKEVAEPTNLRIRRAELWALLWLGRKDEARTALRVDVQSLPSPYHYSINYSWWSGPARAALLLGERTVALSVLREACTEASGRRLVRNNFTADPLMAPFRDDPEVNAILADPAEKKPAAEAAPLDAKSVAVLAFANLSDDKENEYFSDGISEELLTVLQKIPGLHVTSRTSSFYFKGRNATTQEIGQKLAVANLVIGSVRKAGNQVRVSAQLCRASTGEQVWSDSYTRDLKDVFALQTELAQTIVAQFRPQLGVGPTDTLSAQVEAAEKGGTHNAEAHQFYLQGRYYAVRFALEDLERAVAFFQKAVDLDPHYARAWAALSQAASLVAGYANTRADFTAGNALAGKAADRALALEPDLAVALLAKGDLQSGPEFNWPGAQLSYRRALELAPNDADVFVDMGRLAYTLNQLDRSLDYFTRAERLDPANPAVRTYRAFALMAANRLAEAKTEFQEVIALNPSSPWSYGGLAWALALEGNFDQALQFAQKSALPWAQRFGVALAQSGRHDPAAAEAAVAEMIKLDAEVAAYQIAQIFAFRGDADRAFEWLERAYRQRDPGLAWVRPDRLFNPIHGDARWRPFLHKVGLADEQLP